MKKVLFAFVVVALVCLFASSATAHHCQGSHANQPGCSTPGTVTFSDTFNRGADTFVPPWYQEGIATRESLVTDSAIKRKGSHSAKMAVKNTDVPPGSGTYPRSWLSKERLFCEGTDVYIADSIYLDGIPSAPWVMLSEHGFAEPFNMPPLTLQIESGQLVLNHNTGLKGSTTDPWRYERLGGTPALSRQWMDVIMHVKWSRNSSVGFVEMWVNGSKVLGPTYRSTLHRSDTGCGWAVILNYRDLNSMSSYTLYHDEFKVGTSYAAVAP